MEQYHNLLQTILDTGIKKTDRTGTGTLSVFAPQMRFNLADGFPLLTTKKLHTKSIVHELLWILSGSTNVKYLQDNGVRIWDEWADENGDLGPVYGKQWRAWPDTQRAPDFYGAYPKSIDQMQQMVDLLKGQPDSRRMVVSAWNVADLPQMALSPCHCLFQFYTEPLSQQQRFDFALNDESQLTTLEQAQLENAQQEGELDAELDSLDVPRFRLSCQLYQRSADVFLGVPFNIASYALLTHMMAQVVNMVPGEFIWTGGDTHLYLNHLDQAREQLTRLSYPQPTLRLNPEVTDLFSFKYEDINFDNYQSHPSIKAKVSV